MSDDQGIYERLKARFDTHHTRKQGGRDLLYVSGEQVVGRLNDVLGFDGWSFEVKDVKVLEDEVWASGRMTVYVGERTIVREQTGGQIINRTRGVPAQPARPAQPADGDRPAIPAVDAKPAVKGEIIEIANDIKGAVTDTLKKCATLFGVGAYLYDESERREVEAEMRGANRPGPRPVDPAARSSRPAAPTPIDTRVHDAAVLTGAPPVKSEARRELEAAWAKGKAYAATIGLDPADVDLAALDDAALTDVLEGLRQQCTYVLAERKKQAAGAA